MLISLFCNLSFRSFYKSEKIRKILNINKVTQEIF